MQSQTWLYAAAGYDVALAAFHLGFWRLFRWSEELPKLHPVNRGVVQALNVMLTCVLLFMAALLLLRPAELTGTPLGRLLLAGMTAFWVVRAVLQPFLWRGLPAATNAAFAVLFTLGAGLHALAFPGAVTMLHFEDLKTGDRYNTPEHTVTAEEIVEFARRYDPQPFHTDPTAAKGTLFGQLVASGWHTAAVSMGLMVRGELPLDGGVIGQGVEKLRWPRPVKPGDRLRVVMEVAGLEPHPARAGYGNLRLFCRTLNQEGKAVQEMTATLLIARRPAG